MRGRTGVPDLYQGVLIAIRSIYSFKASALNEYKNFRRGVNQPVKEVSGTRTYITSQNHGYAVVSESLKSGKLSFINANDGTCEGIEYPEEQAFSVQFHPEACSGPKDTAFLFDKFIDLMKGAH